MVWPAIIAGAAALGGSLLGAAGGKRDADLQQKFAQYGVRWKVEDAKQAGIHPLFALGGNTATYTPGPYSSAGAGIGDSLSRFGQDVSRSFDTTRTADERFEVRHRALQLQRGELENQLLAAQIAKLSKDQVGPTLPGSHPMIQGQADSVVSPSVPGAPPGQLVEADRVPSATVGRPELGAGVAPSSRYVRTREGLEAVPHPEAYEDADIGNPAAWGWYVRNKLLPFFGGKDAAPPKAWLRAFPGATGWRYSFGQWVPVYPRQAPRGGRYQAPRSRFRRSRP